MPFNGPNSRIGPQSAVLIVIGIVAALGVLGASLTPVSAIQILGFATLIEVSLLSLLNTINTAARAEAKTEEVKKTAERAAEKVEQVAVTQKNVEMKHDEQVKRQVDKLNDIADVGDRTHTLVNSNMGVQLK